MKKFTLSIFILIFPLHIFSQPCLPQGIYFTTQGQIDSFPINYPNCTEIQGFVYIADDNKTITNLNGLSVLTSIGHYLEISVVPNLNDLSGLHNLTSIGYNLEILLATGLSDLSGFNSLGYIGGSLILEHNFGLMDLTGLNNLSYIGEDIWIGYCDSLTSLAGLESLTHISGNLNLGDNDYTGYCGNVALISLTGLDNITTVEGDVEIHLNPLLPDLTGLNKLESVGGRLSIESDTSLTSLTGLEKLTSIGGLNIGGNTNLISLLGLESLATINQTLLIITNPLLDNLEGLDSLVSAEEIIIAKNNSLTRLDGIDNIAHESINNIEIRENPLLSKCEVQSVCDYLLSNVGTVEIYDNAPGCNSEKEVKSKCPVTTSEQHTYHELIISQNPFTTSTTLSYTLDKPGNVQFTIYNVQSQIVFMMQEKQLKGEQQVQWNAEGLPSGMYYFRIQAGQGIAVRKLIVR